MSAPTQTRVGVPVMGNFAWMGGVIYVHNLVKANAALPGKQQLKLFLIVQSGRGGELHFFKPLYPLLHGIVIEGMPQLDPEAPAELPVHHVAQWVDIVRHVDVYYPLDANLDLHGERHPPALFWIPDFQHLHCPWFFSPEVIDQRNRAYARIVKEDQGVVFSSQEALNDFRLHFPESLAHTWLLRFCTIVNPEWFAGDPPAVQRKHNLPDRFILCANQLWKHKDHATLLRCMAILAARGQGTTLVCTGQTMDEGFGEYFSELTGLREELGLTDSVRFLGSIPRADQIQLMRRCLAIAQPSLFEGWSTVVEDAKALGKALVLSDIAVHREQAPARAEFFRAGDPEDMARAMAATLESAVPGPDSFEGPARAASEIRVREFGLRFATIAAEARQILPGGAKRAD